jgi:ferric-dicitrate binding protein FerR (iron transport regulator)
MGLRVIATLAFAALGLLRPASSDVRGQSRQLGAARHASGALTVVRAEGIENRLVGGGPLALFEHDVVGTDANSRGVLDVADGSRITLDENTTCKMLYRWERGRSLTPIVRLLRGEISITAKRGAAIPEIETPVGVIAARGAAELSVRVTGDGEAAVSVVRGAVDVATASGPCRLRGPAAGSLRWGKPCAAVAAAEAPPDAGSFGRWWRRGRDFSRPPEVLPSPEPADFEPR